MSRGQLDLFSPRQRKALGWDGICGGSSRAGMRKVRRPLDLRRHLHVVLRAESARGSRSLLHHRNRSRVAHIVYRNATAQGIAVDRFENVGNHLHLLVRAPSREAFQAFLKGIAGVIARTITGAQRGQAIAGARAARTRKFWDALAYSRVISWGRELRAVRAYLGKNRLDAVGFRGTYLKITGTGRPVVVAGDPGLWKIARERGLV